jgi:hypothetical protein
MDENKSTANAASGAFIPPEEIMSGLQRTEDSHDTSGEKQVSYDENTGTITAEVVPGRTSSIPDFAPPPYTAATSAENEQAAPLAEAPTQKAVEHQISENEMPTIVQLCSGRYEISTTWPEFADNLPVDSSWLS